MPLTEQEKIGLSQQLATLLEGNEPEAMVATLQRIGERKAFDDQISDRERDRWNALAQSCQTVATELERANAPQRATAGQGQPGDGQLPRASTLGEQSPQEPAQNSA